MCAQLKDLLRILSARFMRKWDIVREQARPIYVDDAGEFVITIFSRSNLPLTANLAGNVCVWQ